MDFTASIYESIFRRDCVNCPTATPSCPPCLSSQICTTTIRTCNACATAQCVRDPGLSSPSSSNTTSSVLPGVLGGVLGVLIVCIACYALYRYRSRSTQGLNFFSRGRKSTRLGSVDYYDSSQKAANSGIIFVPNTSPMYVNFNHPSVNLTPPQQPFDDTDAYNQNIISGINRHSNAVSMRTLGSLDQRASHGSNIIPIALDSDVNSVKETTFQFEVPTSEIITTQLQVDHQGEKRDRTTVSSSISDLTLPGLAHLSILSNDSKAMSMRLSDYNPSIISPVSPDQQGQRVAVSIHGQTMVHQAVRAKPALIKVNSIRSPPGGSRGGGRVGRKPSTKANSNKAPSITIDEKTNTKTTIPMDEKRNMKPLIPMDDNTNKNENINTSTTMDNNTNTNANTTSPNIMDDNVNINMISRSDEKANTDTNATT